MYKNIIPNLVSVETNIKQIKGTSFLSNLNFYEEINRKNKFHYKIVIENRLNFPKDYDFKSGYFYKKDDIWYFERKFPVVKLKFCYNTTTRTFYFNNAYFQVPFELGYIFPVGRHIEDIINLELFLADYLLFRGSAFAVNGHNTVLMAPSCNGKTALIKKIIEHGGQYISEDILVINPQENMIYPTTYFHNFGRQANKFLKNKLNKKNVIANPVNLDKIILFQNSTNSNYLSSTKNFFQFINLSSLLFIKNHFIRSYLFQENLNDALFEQINSLKNLAINATFCQIKNFEFADLKIEMPNLMQEQNMTHWDNLNTDYDKNWQSSGRQAMSRMENNFIIKYLKEKNASRILDLGCGTGRILKNLIDHSLQDTAIYGLDISSQMVAICQKKFADIQKVKEIRVNDIASGQIGLDGAFDFITAIRVLKYNNNWQETLINLHDKLSANGILVFTMPNNNSINRFFEYNIKIHRTTKKELNAVLKQNGFKILEITSFSKIPDYFYNLSDNPIYVRLLLLAEKILEKIIGKTLFGRILFIAVQKI